MKTVVQSIQFVTEIRIWNFTNKEQTHTDVGRGPREVVYTHSWSWALLEKPPVVQLLKKFLKFC
jgi:hypothetical protein